MDFLKGASSLETITINSSFMIRASTYDTRLRQIESESKQPDFQIMTANVVNTPHDILACAGTYILRFLGVIYINIIFLIT